MSQLNNPELNPIINGSRRLPKQRWEIQPQNPQLASELSQKTNLLPIVNQLLINRGITTPEQALIFLNPETLKLPSPLEDFPDLAISLELLQHSIATQEKIAICGDYDADGMTSTALLLRSLRYLGAQVDYAIPSRMHEGYGINTRIVEDFQDEGVGLILTVDNGIAAFEPIARAKELGLKVIITDHHEVPQKIPPADAILNPKLIAPSSPYRGVAGVGVAYILAVCLAQQMGKAKELINPMLELFTLGTIADLAPLNGVNRRWVKRGLRQLPKSSLAGIQALIQMSGVQAKTSEDSIKNNIANNIQANNIQANNIQANAKASQAKNKKTLKPEDIGFRLGPRINAIGRIGDPQTVIELLTTDDMGLALERAMNCEDINRRRQDMCTEIEKSAIATVETLYAGSLEDDRVLVVVQPEWHHGVIGIVASRLVERFGVPVFIGTYEDEESNKKHIRGSARGIPEFHVFEALEYCDELLGKYGGHKAAGGFSLPSENLEVFRERLSEFANGCLEIQHLKPLLKIDAQINFNDITPELYQQLNSLEPCGIDNPDPVFWSNNVRIIEQGTIGKGHIKLTLAQTINHKDYKIKAIAWRWREYCPLPSHLDIAYKLKENNFNGNTSIELEVTGVRLPIQSSEGINHQRQTKPVTTKFTYQQRHYNCGIYPNGTSQELRIKNSGGKVLAFKLGESTALLGKSRQEAKEVDASQPPYKNIIQAALNALSDLSNK
ncbi:MAG: DHH family phosphoesterase [Cyanobacteria bacterium P01_A01_bin.84]